MATSPSARFSGPSGGSPRADATRDGKRSDSAAISALRPRARSGGVMSPAAAATAAASLQERKASSPPPSARSSKDAHRRSGAYQTPVCTGVIPPAGTSG
ncbi:hypothetical protein WME89_05350 [Sorangium sp. So ce321]|uniref:hypothetical protein n=1 Tax=Sorangium sp. So ce321 TaxID=3133300 RepID=UPI003F5F7C58